MKLYKILLIYKIYPELNEGETSQDTVECNEEISYWRCMKRWFWRLSTNYRTIREWGMGVLWRMNPGCIMSSWGYCYMQCLRAKLQLTASKHQSKELTPLPSHWTIQNPIFWATQSRSALLHPPILTLHNEGWGKLKEWA
jgi:hypothetical protein